MQRLLALCSVLMLANGLAACAASNNFAPAVDVSDFEAIPPSGVYTASSNDTLYAIAWRYGLDYNTLAERNHIAPPYDIHVGQVIKLVETKTPAAPAPAPAIPAAPAPSQPEITKSTTPVTNHAREPDFKASGWHWPAHGKLLTVFSKRNKGIDISGSMGAPVYAALAGKVVYAGSGLRGYGNLIIIKHNSKYLSAYAYSKKVLVREGQWVKTGQKIADMGRGTSGKAELHFEIRRAGVPVNPLNLLHRF